MKLLGCLLLLSCGIGLGCERSLRLKEREMRLNEAKVMAEAMRGEIAYAARPLAEMICGLQRFSLCREAMRLPQWEENPAQALQSAASSLFDQPGDRALFEDWCCCLGSSDTETQLRQIDLFLLRIEENRADAVLQRAQKAPLQRALGVCGALVLCILLI